MKRAFISHSSKQKFMVDDIIKILGKDSCIVDKYDFHSGNQVEIEIKQNINLSDLFVLLISSDALDSDWVDFELRYVRERVREGRVSFCPFIIDQNIHINDFRIKPWVKDYIVDCIPNAFIISKIIERRLRDIRNRDYPYFAKRDGLFQGRDEDMAELDKDLIIKEYKRAIFISGIPHIGKKFFARRFLRDKLTVGTKDDFISIQIGEHDSIEDYILRLNHIVRLLSRNEIGDLMSGICSIQQKLEVAVRLTNDLFSFKEKLLIIDDWGIVQSNGVVTKWFLEMINDQSLSPETGIFVISKNTVKRSLLTKNPIVSRQLKPLSKEAIELLLIQYAEIRELHLSKEQRQQLMSKMKGYPSTVYTVIDAIKKGSFIDGMNTLYEDLEQKNDELSYIVRILGNDDTKDKLQILIILSMFEFISLDLLENICSPLPMEIFLEEFYSMSLYESFGSANEYIRLSPSVADYINRYKLELRPEFRNKLTKLTQESLTLMSNEVTDLSAFLYNVKENIRSGNTKGKVEKYLLPSFFLKVIVEEYNKGDRASYKNVVNLCDKILKDSNNIYEHMVYNIRYWLCSALCRLQSMRFFDEVEYFERDNAYDFLRGFFERIAKRFPEAERYYEKAISKSRDGETLYKTKQELVIVRMKLGNYQAALDLAKECYLKNPYNPYHIVAYYRCIIKSNFPDVKLLEELMAQMEKTYSDQRDLDIETMRGEFAYYVDKDEEKALRILRTLHIRNKKHPYCAEALNEIENVRLIK